MKFVVYFIAAMIVFFLFVPKTGTTEIRNLPILIALLVIIAGLALWQFLRRAEFMRKIKKAIKNNGYEIMKICFNPFAARLHGRYSVTFKAKDEIITAILLVRRRKYQHYHFVSTQELEFYRSNRVVFNSTKTYGATISNLVETKKVGKQKLKWDEADRNIIIFNKIPDHITDSVQKNLLGKGDRVCETETYIADFESFSEYLTEFNSNNNVAN